MNTNTTNTKTFKAVLASLIAENKLIADKPIKVDGRQIIKSAANGEIYVLNTEKNKAFRYSADASECVVIPCGEFNRQVSLYKARLQQAMLDRHTAEVRAKEAERRAAYNEVGNINAPATTTAIRLDAEREDSKFDGRQADEIFSKSTVEAYEEGKGFFDDENEPAVTLGHHRALFTNWEEVKETTKTAKDGSRYVSKAYLKLTFVVNGTEFSSRCYSKGFESFKKNINATHHGIFEYTRSTKVLDDLKGEFIDIWVIWNDTLNELQAEFFDRAAWEARRNHKAQVAANSIRSGNTRPTEYKATK